MIYCILKLNVKEAGGQHLKNCSGLGTQERIPFPYNNITL
jgi:hypothetical protein